MTHNLFVEFKRFVKKGEFYLLNLYKIFIHKRKSFYYLLNWDLSYRFCLKQDSILLYLLDFLLNKLKNLLIFWHIIQTIVFLIIFRK